ncbi:MAG: family 20 glycosylhydrolase [Propionibacteriaceae bacterium]|nr:family 20 glycosylhydrolase [Propionibacteriaceae bacterium]
MDTMTQAPSPVSSDRPGGSQPWKGFSLDIARSFYPLPVLVRMVDRLADLGLNVFHLHLTDDQGWRIEIPGRPELTERSGATAVRGGDSGWLTVGDWSALVAHGQARGVAIVPEVDVPGHTNAALHACHELNPGGVAPDAYDGDKVGFSQLRADLPATEVFLRDVFGALADMTPGEWIHIGGDECQSMTDPEYVDLVQMVTGIVESTGKKPVAWQEAALADLGERLALQFWMSVDNEDKWAAMDPAVLEKSPSVRSRRALLRQAAKGAGVIMSPARYAYFDMKYELSDQRGQDWAGCLSVDKARDWDPRTVLPGLDPARIMGLEAAMWTEFIHTEADLHAMVQPRLAAFAEVANRF